MNLTREIAVAAVCLFAAATTGGAHAQSAAGTPDYVPERAGQWVVDLRATAVNPHSKANIVTAAGAPTGQGVHIGDDTIPSLGVNYFFTDHWAVEGSIGSSRHTVSSTGTGGAAMFKTDVLATIVTGQYHFRTDQKVSPYVGAGLDYLDWYHGRNENAYTVHLKNRAGWALQAGVDVALKGHWALNFDYKKLFNKTTATINGGALRSNVKLDPDVASIGIAYRF